MARTPTRETADSIAKWVTIFVTVAGALWGALTTVQTQALEARRPFLDLQLKLYQDATETASILATSSDPDEVGKAETRFWRLYWGILAMVENGGINQKAGGVEGAMVRFGDALHETPRDLNKLRRASLDLAHTCRDSLAISWGVKDWSSPQYSASSLRD
jgi:hypothetical protein